MTPAAAGVVALLMAAAALVAAASVSVEGSEFRVALADGSLLPQEAPKGMALTFGDGAAATWRIVPPQSRGNLLGSFRP
jgi:hypothetical protein